MFRWLPALAMVSLLAAGPVRAATHVVTQSGFSFLPTNLVILVGDTVRWEHTSGTHTVTNGTGASDPEAGALFDAPLSGSDPVFEYTFNDPGLIDYFCRPHEVFGMTGSIFVEAPVPAEAATWSRIKRLLGDRG
jgi:plastocyanin